MKKLAVVPFGGNALLRDDQKGTIEQQEQKTFNYKQQNQQIAEFS